MSDYKNQNLNDAIKAEAEVKQSRHIAFTVSFIALCLTLLTGYGCSRPSAQELCIERGGDWREVAKESQTERRAMGCVMSGAVN